METEKEKKKEEFQTEKKWKRKKTETEKKQFFFVHGSLTGVKVAGPIAAHLHAALLGLACCM